MDADDVELDLHVVVVQPSGRLPTVIRHGEVDVAVEQSIVKAVRRTARFEGLAEIDVDATAVTFIDSSGLRALVLGREEALSHGLQYTVHITAGSFVARVVGRYDPLVFLAPLFLGGALLLAMLFFVAPAVFLAALFLAPF